MDKYHFLVADGVAKLHNHHSTVAKKWEVGNIKARGQYKENVKKLQDHPGEGESNMSRLQT